MTVFVDARIPVAFGVTPGEGDYVFRPDVSGVSVHPLGCACCVARSAAALALDRVFLDRVRGRVPWFDRVVVLGQGDAVRRALREDGVVEARFRSAA